MKSDNSVTTSIRKEQHMPQHILASALAAMINYPLWRASAIGQSGFRFSPSSSSTIGGNAGRGIIALHPSLQPYAYAFAPPYKGMMAVMLGMTWARAFIFYGSAAGKEKLRTEYDWIHPSVYTLLPPLVVSTIVQCVNQPIVRSSITLQNPQSDLPNTRSAVKMIYNNHGLKGLWHGTSAGILKTVPKYCTAILVKDYMETKLQQPDRSSETYETDKLIRSACKSTAAGIAGAALTNPLDVIRNEMFKTNKSLLDAIKSLHIEYNGNKWMMRGMGKNLVAVSVPVGCTIFFTDMLIQLSGE